MFRTGLIRTLQLQNESISILGRHRIGLRQASTTVAPASTPFFDVKIPHISQSDPQSSAQIPYVPDFWDSSPPSIEHASEETLPKLLVVAGAGTHHGGGPSHNLLDISNSSAVVGSSDSHPEVGGLWDDMADDIGLPPTKDVKKTIWKMFSKSNYN